MIRAYLKQDKNQVMQLLKLNTPEYFAESEVNEFLTYLENDAQNYFIYEESNQILGAGGMNYGFDYGKTARTSWDIIHPQYQGKGIGAKLLLFRINKIKEHRKVNKIVVRTAQMVYQFYQKSGFSLEFI